MPISVDWVIETATGLPGMQDFRWIVGDRALELGRVHAPQSAVDRTEPRAAREIFRRAAFVLDRVRLAVIEADAARLAGQRQRE